MHKQLRFLSGFILIGQVWAQTQPQGPYLGQTSPGNVPQIFAPEFISTEAFEFAGSFSPDGRTYVFTRRPDAAGAANRLYITVMNADGIWSVPRLAPFAQNVMEFEPHIPPDGKVVYFGSERPKPRGTSGQGEIWLAKRTPQGWSAAQYLQGTVNRGMSMYVTATRKGDLYYTGFDKKRYGIFRAVLTETGYAEPEYLGPEINGIRPAHPFIDPDERYLLMDAYTGGPGKPSLYISFRTPQGGWTPAVKLGPEINATETEFAPSVSPDGRFLFFHRQLGENGDIYWVDASVLEACRPRATIDE